MEGMLYICGGTAGRGPMLLMMKRATLVVLMGLLAVTRCDFKVPLMVSWGTLTVESVIVTPATS